MIFKPRRTVLPSGLTVVTVEANHLHSAMATVYVRVGSRHETTETNGVSHLLEHLFFRGSKRYPDSVQMNLAVEAVGGNLNGVTMRDSSYFYSPVHPDGVGVALRILGDMLTQPRLVQLATEKQIILEEMLDEVDEKGRDIDPDNLARQVLYEHHPLGFKIAGTPESVKALTLRQARAHFEQFYVTGNVVVSVTGPVAHDQVLEWATRDFKHLPRGPRVQEAPPGPPSTRGPRLTFVSLEESQVEFRLVFPTVPEDHPDAIALGLLRRVLDDGLSSRLPHTIVEKRGLAYSIGATMELFHDAGTFEIDGACAPERLGPVVDAVFSTLATLRRGQITPAELKLARHRTRLFMDFLADSPGDLCGWFGGLELYREPESFEQRVRQVNAVTKADLVRVARHYLVPDTLVAVGVGPREAKVKFQRSLDRSRRLLGA